MTTTTCFGRLICLGALCIGVPAAASATEATPLQSSLVFNSAPVGTATGSAQQLTATFTVTGFSGSFIPVAAAHYGHDYNVGAVTCTAAAPGETCSVPIIFQPTLPGGRKDALFLKDSVGTLLATVLLYGVGESPLAALNPGIVTKVPYSLPGAQYVYSSTVDEDGTAYFLDSITSSVVSLTKAGVLTKLPITGLSSPNGISIDGAGTLYIAQNTYSDQIIKYSTSGIQSSVTLRPPAPYVACSNSNGGALEFLYSTAVDGVGDIFALEILCQEIFELKANGTYVTTAINPSITQPTYITLDDKDDAFFSGYTINELTSSGAQAQINAVGPTAGIAVDASGIVYAGRYFSGGVGVGLLQPSNYSSTTLQLDANAAILGLGLGSDGTLFAGDYNNIDVVDRSQGSIAFGEQTAGLASSIQIVQMVNIGNQPLTVSRVSLVGAGYAIQASGGVDCSSGIVLAPASYCQVGVVLTATHAGNWNGSVSFTSNSLNQTSSLAMVNLTGFVYGPYVTATPSPLAFPAQQIHDSSAAQVVTLTNQGLLYAALIGTPVSSNPAFSVTLGSCAAGLVLGASCQLSVTFAPTALQSYSGTITIPIASSGGGANTATSFNVSGLSTARTALGEQVDYLGTGSAEFTVWRPSSGEWYSINGAGSLVATQWGLSTDLPVLGDFDGDGKTDVAVWRPSTGTWYIIQSSNQQVATHQWGASTDLPVAGDFDGDGKTDVAVWRPSTGYWYLIQSSNGALVGKQWGAPTDRPVVGDFDGDGKTDLAVFRPSTGYWYIVQSSNSAVVAKQWGASTDIPVLGDFDGDGKTDIAVYRPSTGYWYIIQSSNGSVVAKQWGQAGDIPVARDYDGDGKTDIAVWRPSTGYWYVILSSTGLEKAVQWGTATDVPVNSLGR